VREALGDLLAAGEEYETVGVRNPALAPWMSRAALAHLRLGERDAAVELSEENLDRATRFGAPFTAGRAPRVHGIVVGGDAGPSALTPAERRVADAVAGGLSNREAAQALFLTEKTVETHLRSAYRKLGISSRVQLADALAAGGAGDEVGAPAELHLR